MDMLIEGVHFDLVTTDLRSLGWKSAAANLSDIAAMGGAPCFCLIGLGIPRGVTVEEIDAFYRGFAALAGRYGADIVGGDTCASKQGLVITVTVLGEARRARIITRDGARPGDLVFVTGTLGDSGAGLELLRSSECGVRKGKTTKQKQRTWCKRLIGRHLRPEPRVEWGMKLAASGCVTAMIDVSDGLSSDLAHICLESRAGAEIAADRIPLSRQLRAAAGLKRSALEYALSGGEDYELLFTVPASKAERMRRLGLPATEIGRITKGRTLKLAAADGSVCPLRPSGFDHFRGAVRRTGVHR